MSVARWLILLAAFAAPLHAEEPYNLGVLRLEDAVRKMTSLNAAKIGLTDRGLLRPGQFADVTVFDPATVIDKSTCEKPFQYPEGIAFVLCNGTLTLDQGKPTGDKPGRVLRHGQ